MSSVPSWSLFGDGTLIVQGPQIEIYPGPALPNLTATPISEEGVQAILEAARDAGLMDGDATYGNDCIADAATTVFTTNADGETSVVSAYALDVGEPAGTCVAARMTAMPEPRWPSSRRCSATCRAGCRTGAVGAEDPYDPTEMRVYVQPYQGDAELPQGAIEWPLDAPLDAFGEPAANAPTDTRCGVVSGSDLATLLRRGAERERADALDERRDRVRADLPAAAARRAHLLTLGIRAGSGRTPSPIHHHLTYGASGEEGGAMVWHSRRRQAARDRGDRRGVGPGRRMRRR